LTLNISRFHGLLRQKVDMLISSKPLFLFILALLASSACRQETPQALPLAPGVPLALARERAARLDSVSYALHFDLPERREAPVRGRITIRFHARDARRPLALDFRAERAQMLTLRVNARQTPIDLRDEHLVLPASALRAGGNEVEVEFLAGDQSLNRDEEYLYTLLVPERARTVFPCFDQPDLKARFALSLEMPDGWMAVSNGAVLKETKVGDERRRLAFAPTPPISTYLFAFAAGRFRMWHDNAGGQPMTMYYRENDTEKVAANAPEIFALHAAALDWLEDYCAIPYPFGKFDFVLLPGFQYGGMEHPGCIFYREPSLMLEANATEQQRLGRARLIAHETAHMWFGDLVTMRWFDDVWLKEVFANFMAAKIVDPSFPEMNHRLGFLLAHHPAAYSEDRSTGAHPIQQELENLDQAGALYGRIIYQKSPVVMRQLELILGEQALRDGLREYLDAYRFGNATWDDLIALLDRRAAEDLERWSAAWIKEAGMPEVRLEWKARDSRLAAIAAQQTPTPGGAYRAQRIETALLYEKASPRLLTLEIAGQERRFALDSLVPPPIALLPSASEWGYGYFPLDANSRRYLLERLPEQDDALLRGAGWVALYEECLRGELAPETLLPALRRALEREDEPQLRNYLLETAHTVFWRLLPAEERVARAPALEAQLWALLERSTTRSTRSAYFRAYLGFASTPEAARRLWRLWSGQEVVAGLPLSEVDLVDLACTLALLLSDESEAILARQLERTNNPDRRRRLAFVAPALSPEAARRDSFFNSLHRPENRRQEPWVVEALEYLHHPLRAKASEKYILPSLELLEEIQRTGDIFFPQQWIAATLRGHCSASAADIVRDFLAARPDFPHRLSNKVRMAADLLWRAGVDAK
jgi:aminopeptidase N